MGIAAASTLGCVMGVLFIYCLLTSESVSWAGQMDGSAAAVGQNASGSTNSPVASDVTVDSLFKQLLEGDAFQAAQELSTIKDPQVVDRLIKVLASSPDESLRGYVIDALGKIGDPGAVEILISMLEDQTGSQPVPDNYAHVEGNVTVISLKEMSGGLSALRRQRAADALGKIKDARAVEPLIKALDDENYLLAIAAVRALAEIKSPRAVESLITALQKEHFRARFQVVFCLGEIQDERAILPLIKVFEEDTDAYVRDQAFNALHKFSFTDKPDLAARLGAALIKLYRNGDRRDRILSVWFLGELKVPSAVEVLLEAAASQEADLREVAAEALGNVGGTQALDALEQLAGDQEEAVRQAAQKALEKIRAIH